MSMHDKASKACKNSKQGIECAATIPVSTKDFEEVAGIDGVENQREQLRLIASAGCADGCNCSSSDAQWTDDTFTAINATAFDANQVKKRPTLIRQGLK